VGNLAAAKVGGFYSYAGGMVQDLETISTDKIPQGVYAGPDLSNDKQGRAGVSSV